MSAAAVYPVTPEKRHDAKQATVRAAWCCDDNRLVVHSMAGPLGADWDLAGVLGVIDSAEDVWWAPYALDSHYLGVRFTHEGRQRTLRFRVDCPPEVLEWAAGPGAAEAAPDEAGTADLLAGFKAATLRGASFASGGAVVVDVLDDDGAEHRWPLAAALGAIDSAKEVRWLDDPVDVGYGLLVVTRTGGLDDAVARPAERTVLFRASRQEACKATGCPRAEGLPGHYPEAWELAVALTETAYVLHDLWRCNDDAERRALGTRVGSVLDRWARHPSWHAVPPPEEPEADPVDVTREDPRDSRGHRIYDAIYAALQSEGEHTDRPGERASYLARDVLQIAQGTGLDRVIATLPPDSHVSDAALILEELSDREYLRVRGNADGGVEVWARG